MNEHAIVRSMLLRMAGGVPATAALAKAVLEWAQPHAEWLVPACEDELSWEALLAGLAEPRAPAARPQVLDLADHLAELLVLPPIDAALLRLMVACDRLPRVGALARVAARHGHDLPLLLGELAGAAPHEADRAVRRSLPVRLDLASFVSNRQGEVEVSIRWTLERLLDRAPVGGEAMLDALVGQRQPATLSLAAFAHVADSDFLVRLVAGALSEGTAGINILIHGPPGTGKTELARTLATAAGADVSLLLTGPPGTGKTAFAHHLARAVDRPLLVKRASDLLSKWVGETEAQIANAFAEARRREAVLLFDEADSLLFDRATARTSWEVGQVNELLTWLDRHPLPVIAATNHEARLDPATLRRFVFKLRLAPLGRERSARAFERFFGIAAPAALAEVGGLIAQGHRATDRHRHRGGQGLPRHAWRVRRVRDQSA